MSVKRNREKRLDALTALGVYRQQFAEAIELTAKLMEDCAKAEKKTKAKDYEPIVTKVNKTGQEYQAKNVWTTMVEQYRKDIIANLAQLGLTPAGLKKLNDELSKKPPKPSGIAAHVAHLNGK